MSTHTDGAPSGRVDQNFVRRVEEIASFRSERGRFPSSRSDVLPERVLGRWLSNVRTTHRGKIGKGPHLSPQRVQVLNDLIPGWNDVTPGQIADEKTFRERLDKVAEFRRANGRMPASGTNEADGLGGWLSRVKGASRGKGNMAWNPSRQKMIADILPGWLEGDAS